VPITAECSPFRLSVPLCENSVRSSVLCLPPSALCLPPSVPAPAPRPRPQPRARTRFRVSVPLYASFEPPRLPVPLCRLLRSAPLSGCLSPCVKTLCGLPSSVLRPPSSVLRPPSSVLRPPPSALRPLSSVLCPLSAVRRPRPRPQPRARTRFRVSVPLYASFEPPRLPVPLCRLLRSAPLSGCLSPCVKTLCGLPSSVFRLPPSVFRPLSPPPPPVPALSPARGHASGCLSPCTHLLNHPDCLSPCAVYCGVLPFQGVCPPV
jgi:hypothetical protein